MALEPSIGLSGNLIGLVGLGLGLGYIWFEMQFVRVTGEGVMLRRVLWTRKIARSEIRTDGHLVREGALANQTTPTLRLVDGSEVRLRSLRSSTEERAAKTMDEILQLLGPDLDGVPDARPRQ